MPSIVERIIKSAHVSRATAYRVFAGDDGVAEETRKRVLRAISVVGEPPLRRRRKPSQRIALWAPGFGEMLESVRHREVVQALESATADQGLSLEVISDPVPKDALEAIRKIDRLKVRGVMLLSFYSVRIRRAIAGKWPVVLLFEPGYDERLAELSTDDFSAGSLATWHLIKQGHRRISVVVGEGRRSVGFSTLFSGGWAQALTVVKLPVDDRLVLRHVKNLEFVSGKEGLPPAVDDFLNLDPRPTAVIGRCETVWGMVEGFAGAGLRVPEDVSVVGYGHATQNGRNNPKLTRVDYSPRRVAETALGILGAQNFIYGSMKIPVHFEDGSSVKRLSVRK